MKNVIISIYEQMLNGLQLPIQIICKSEKYNIDNYKINDNDLHEFIEQYANKHEIVNKIFYIVMEGKKSSLNSTSFLIEKSLSDMNLNYTNVTELNYNDWANIQSFTSKYVKDENYYYKTLYINDWPSYCTVGWLEFLYNTHMNIDVNCFISPQGNAESIKLLKKKLIQCNVGSEYEFDKTGDDNIYYSELESIQYMLDELRSNSGKMFFTSYYITVKGKTIEDLNDNYNNIKHWLISKSISANDCLLFQQTAFKNYQTNRDSLNKYYNFTTSTMKCFFPFLSLNICDKNGVYIGINQENKNLIFLDIFARQYAVILIMGLMGSGKSFLAKHLIKNLADSGVEIMILDKSGEYNIFNENKNIIVNSNKSFKEYVDILQEYIKNVDNDFKNKKSKPRLLLVDELWAYIQDNEFADQFNRIFNEIILEGRKKYLAVCFMSQLIESLATNKAGQIIMKTANIKFLMKMNYNESQLMSKEFDLNDQQKNFLVTAQHEGLLMVNSNCIKFKVKTTDSRNKLYNTNPNNTDKGE